MIVKRQKSFTKLREVKKLSNIAWKSSLKDKAGGLPEPSKKTKKLMMKLERLGNKNPKSAAGKEAMKRFEDNFDNRLDKVSAPYYRKHLFD